MPRPVKAGLDRLDRAQEASAALSGRDVAGGDLVFVGGEGRQDFGLLGLRDLDEVQGTPEFRCDLIEFCRGDPEVAVGLLKAERRRAGLGGRELEGPEGLVLSGGDLHITPFEAVAASAGNCALQFLPSQCGQPLLWLTVFLVPPLMCC
jgi:hypothetical protein